MVWGQRMVWGQSAFSYYGGSGDHHWDFGYNGRSELTGGERRTGAVLGQGTLFAMKGDFDYGYDPIGNRTESNVDGASPAMTYTTNAVNQYTATFRPDGVVQLRFRREPVSGCRVRLHLGWRKPAEDGHPSESE